MLKGRGDPRDWGVRTRSALAAAVVLAAALVVVAAGVLWLLRASLQSSADTASDTRVAQIAAQLQTDAPSTQDAELLATTGETSVVQILRRSGSVLLASPDSPVQALADPLPDGATSRSGSVDLPGLVGDYRVVARGVAGPGGDLTVVVAVDSAPITHTLVTVAALLAAGLPFAVVLTGALTYALVGATLRPVERMRTRAAEVSSSDLSLRLPVPRPRDEVSRLALTLNGMLARLQAGHDAQRRFVGDASHELRSPLTTITAALELARDRPEVLDRRLVATHLLPEAHRMRLLVEDLLLLARADERGLPLRVTDVDLDDVAAAEVARLRTTSGGSTPDLPSGLTIDADVSAVRVRGDEAQLVRVVRNLTDNAARHARTTIRVTTRTVGGVARLVVEDDGPGVPPDDRRRVLERFVRVDEGRARSAGGSGLGLAIVAEVVAAHDGSVTITESRWGGACVTIALPVDGPSQVSSRSR